MGAMRVRRQRRRHPPDARGEHLRALQRGPRASRWIYGKEARSTWRGLATGRFCHVEFCGPVFTRPGLPAPMRVRSPPRHAELTAGLATPRLGGVGGVGAAEVGRGALESSSPRSGSGGLSKSSSPRSGGVDPPCRRGPRSRGCRPPLVGRAPERHRPRWRPCSGACRRPPARR